MIPAIERLLRAYLALRLSVSEPFIEAFRRLGAEPFRAALYPDQAQTDAA